MLIKRPNGVLLHRTQQHGESDWREDNTYKFLFSPAGTVAYETKCGDFQLKDGHFLILHPQLPHKQAGYEREKFLIELSSGFLHEVADSAEVRWHFDIQFALQQQKHPQITQWVSFSKEVLAACEMDEGRVKGDLLFVDHALVQLALLLIKFAVGSHSHEVPSRHLKKESPILYKAIEAMKESYVHSWTLEEMAETVGLGRYQFAHMFKETVGISPYSWLQLYRLVRSQEMLKKNDLTILEIALACGFSSLSVYNQLFKRVYAVSPSSFRKRYR